MINKNHDHQPENNPAKTNDALKKGGTDQPDAPKVGNVKETTGENFTQYLAAHTELDPEDATEDTIDNETDLTEEDLEALGSEGVSMDLGDDEQLRQRTVPLNFSGDDLDIPGAELDDEEEAVGTEDEENNYYSLGGDREDDLSEAPDEEI